jgi:hypothetical protein
MQISTANLLIASQPQAAAQAQPAPAQAAFSAQLEKTAKAGDTGFEPIAFKAGLAPAAETARPAAAAKQPARAYGQAQRLGSNLDLSV